MVVLIGLGIYTNAQSPKFNGVTLCSQSGESLDFYPEKVIYYSKGAPVSRLGSYTWKNTGRWNGSINKYQAYISIVVTVINTKKEIKGTLVYDNNGNILSIETNNGKWTKENCAK